MNAAHLHLMINHIPVLGAIFGLLVLISGIIWRSDHVKNVAMITVVISAMFGAGAYLSGEEAEDEVEDIIAINHDALEEHEESAEVAMWLLIFSGAVCLGAFLAWFATGNYSKVLVLVCMVSLLVSVSAMVYTANKGGLIRHSEILRSSFS